MILLNNVGWHTFADRPVDRLLGYNWQADRPADRYLCIIRRPAYG